MLPTHGGETPARLNGRRILIARSSVQGKKGRSGTAATGRVGYVIFTNLAAATQGESGEWFPFSDASQKRLRRTALLRSIANQ